MTQKHSGSCLCGAVTFKIDGEFDKFFLCHCSRCRKFSGTAHASNLFSFKGKVDWLSGKENVKFYDVPDTRFMKAFCAECGSPLPREREEAVVVPAGTRQSTSRRTRISSSPTGRTGTNIWKRPRRSTSGRGRSSKPLQPARFIIQIFSSRR